MSNLNCPEYYYPGDKIIKLPELDEAGIDIVENEAAD
jgi:hypothetical protein